MIWLTVILCIIYKIFNVCIKKKLIIKKIWKTPKHTDTRKFRNKKWIKILLERKVEKYWHAGQWHAHETRTRKKKKERKKDSEHYSRKHIKAKIVLCVEFRDNKKILRKYPNSFSKCVF
jgi:hypothetical protein